VVKCKICDKETTVVINIGLKPVYICHNCCNAVTLQNVEFLIYLSNYYKMDNT